MNLKKYRYNDKSTFKLFKEYGSLEIAMHPLLLSYYAPTILIVIRI